MASGIVQFWLNCRGVKRARKKECVSLWLWEFSIAFHKYLDYEIATPASGRLAMTLKAAKCHCAEQSDKAISIANRRKTYEIQN